MTKEQAAVLKFHRMFDIQIEVTPKIPSPEVVGLRIRLIREEFDELIIALHQKDLIETADALGDLMYVILGTGVACGIDLEPVFEEIHRSNLTKVGGYKREDGKWIKPDSYSPANIASVLRGI